MYILLERRCITPRSSRTTVVRYVSPAGPSEELRTNSASTRSSGERLGSVPPSPPPARGPRPRPTWATRRHREARSKPVRPAPPARPPPQRPRRSVPSKVVEHETAAAPTQPGWEASAPQPQFPGGWGGGLPRRLPGASRGYRPARTRAGGGEASSSVPAGRGRKDTARGGGRGRDGRRKAPKLAPGSIGFGRADPGRLERPHRGPGDPPTRGAAEVPGSYGPTPVGSRGAATSRRVCPGARREGGGGAEGAGSQAAPSPGPPGRQAAALPVVWARRARRARPSPAFPAQAHTAGLTLGAHRPHATTTVVAPVSLNPGPRAGRSAQAQRSRPKRLHASPPPSLPLGRWSG
uniref:Basic salivary proline-rich protein 2-like n=1 Tax=Mustela putorius furo TaxID=9669 RepID=M3Z731_MUSPF